MIGWIKVKSILLPVILIISCSAIVKEVTIHTYSNPTYRPGRIRTLAILYFKDSQLDAYDTSRLNRKINAAFEQGYPELKIMTTNETSRVLNKHELYSDWDDFYQNYMTYGHPDPEQIGRISSTLKADAILHCALLNVNQRDGQYRTRTAVTIADVKFELFDLPTGKLIWEASSQGFEENELTFEQAPPVYEAVDLAITKILANLPRL